MMYLEDYIELTYVISAICLIVLKLFGILNWSWWWVTAPFWIQLAFVITIFAVFGIALVSGIVYRKIRGKR